MLCNYQRLQAVGDRVTMLSIQIVIVAEFFINIASPCFALQLPDRLCLSFVIIIYASEMGFVPFHRAVCTSTPFEVKASPSLDRFGLASLFCAIWFSGQP